MIPLLFARSYHPNNAWWENLIVEAIVLMAVAVAVAGYGWLNRKDDASDEAKK